jgi:hypothetical protein
METAFEVPLYREGVGLHEPGAIVILAAEQEGDAFPVRRVGGGHAGDVQRIEGQSRGVSIRIRAGELRPTAALFLSIANLFYCNSSREGGASVQTQERQVEDVILLKQRQVTAAVRFRGGATTTLTLPCPLTAQRIRVTHEDVRLAASGACPAKSVRGLRRLPFILVFLSSLTSALPDR